MEFVFVILLATNDLTALYPKSLLFKWYKQYLLHKMAYVLWQMWTVKFTGLDNSEYLVQYGLISLGLWKVSRYGFQEMNKLAA